jgi:hypothetical protein
VIEYPVLDFFDAVLKDDPAALARLDGRRRRVRGRGDFRK